MDCTQHISTRVVDSCFCFVAFSSVVARSLTSENSARSTFNREQHTFFVVAADIIAFCEITRKARVKGYFVLLRNFSLTSVAVNCYLFFSSVDILCYSFNHSCSNNSGVLCCVLVCCNTNLLLFADVVISSQRNLAPLPFQHLPSCFFHRSS